MSAMKNESTILVTGASGMIGSCLVKALLSMGSCVVGIDRCESDISGEGYKHVVVDLGDVSKLKAVFEENEFDRVIHLAALAHKVGENDFSYERY